VNKNFQKITKVEGARRQLETAAQLFFDSGDSISIHTLVGAASGVLQDIATRRQLEPLLLDKLVRDLPDELRGEVRRALRSQQNFLKHADKDGEDSSFDFSKGITPIMLFNAIADLERIDGDIPLVLRAFLAWFYVNNYRDGSLSYSKAWVDYFDSRIGGLRGLSKKEFLEGFLERSQH